MDMDDYQITVKAPDGNAITMSAQQFEVWQKENNPPEKEMEFSKDEYRQRRVCSALYRQYEFVRVKSLENIDQDIYYREKPNELIGETTYRKLTDKTAEKLIRDKYLRIYHMAPGKKVKDAVLTLRVNVMEEVDAINDKLIEVAPNLFWDMETMALTSEPSAPCFRKLFDSDGSDEIAVDANRMNPQVIKTYYNVTVAHLKENEGYIVPDGDLFDIENKHLKPFWTWADEDPDVYNDLLKAAASVFMKNKPKGSFILIGPTRNGKSTFIKMLHIMLGRNNTSAVKLADFNEPRLNMTLSTTFLNAPDEEDEGRKNDLLQSQGLFKSVAAHESVLLKVYFSQKPQWVSTRFMCFFPMNHYPEWSGTGAAACMKRSLILPFKADLSKFDNTGKDFVEETFTAPFYEALVGVLLGIAKYYETHTFELSDKAEEMKKKVNDEVDNITTYINRLRTWFNGYKSVNLVYEDYKIWCDQNNIKWQYKSIFSDRLNMISHGGRYTPSWESDSFKVQRFDETRGRNIFYEDFPVEQLGGKKICDFINGNSDNTGCKSVIFELDQLLEKKKAQEVKGDE